MFALNDLDFCNESQPKFVNINEKPKITLQSNLTNPYLYDDIRMYKEKYATGDHGGLPNAYAKK